MGNPSGYAGLCRFCDVGRSRKTTRYFDVDRSLPSHHGARVEFGQLLRKIFEMDLSFGCSSHPTSLEAESADVSGGICDGSDAWKTGRGFEVRLVVSDSSNCGGTHGLTIPTLSAIFSMGSNILSGGIA